MPVHHPPGVLIHKEPEQMLLGKSGLVFESHGWVLTPLATYSIEARILCKEHYGGDLSAELVPYDLAVGWGPMSDSAVLDKLTLRQNYRFVFWQCGSPPPIPIKEIETHAANMHLIADNEDIRREIASLRVGSLIVMKGYLVEARHPSVPNPWRSSLRRDDTGDGACELMLVRSLRHL